MEHFQAHLSMTSFWGKLREHFYIAKEGFICYQKCGETCNPLFKNLNILPVIFRYASEIVWYTEIKPQKSEQNTEMYNTPHPRHTPTNVFKNVFNT